MTELEALSYTKNLLSTHGLHGWTVVIDRRTKGRAGICRFRTSTIGLSEWLIRLNPDSKVRNTITHEVAHAIVGPRAKAHGYEWRNMHRHLGGDGKARYYDLVNPYTNGEATRKRHARNWVAICPTCGKRYTKARKPITVPGRYYACPPCGRVRGKLTWTNQKTGEVVKPREKIEIYIDKRLWG